MKNKLRRIAAMLLSLIMTISMVGGNVLTVVALDETYAETEMETVVETKTKQRKRKWKLIRKKWKKPSRNPEKR